ncbi:type I-U CRISPR-associated helicase/endonuclease Cas3 [Planctomycetales bacterium]|nr:type I-U CRISPR-associated helicase/endonuclease Cas3 [Planctomycetales bacterium]
MDELSFDQIFSDATGNAPFPWQTALYDKFVKGDFPDAADLPTGLGKTSVVALWLIALANNPAALPRRLVYVVNRRAVVDQTTAEVEKLRANLVDKPELKPVADALRRLCAIPVPEADSPLAISALRGQFADNREWSADPARPAVIVGTVDMIGSGLLFSRYTVGFKRRPHHAAFLAQGALLVHDEAHLEPAFQRLLESLVAEQAAANDSRKLRVIALTATQRNSIVTPFTLTPQDRENEIVKKRVNAAKKLSLVEVEKVRDKIIKLAKTKKSAARAVLIFVRSVEDAEKIADALVKEKSIGKEKVATLTGTMRGEERDALVKNNAVFQRFLPSSSRNAAPVEGAVYLVATSAGEVGVNLSADDLICDLSTFESMAQRFGRVNRFGDCSDSEITVVCDQNMQTKYDEGLKKAREAKKDADKKVKKYEDENKIVVAQLCTLTLLVKLGDDASPSALSNLNAEERAAAFSPLPEMRVAAAIQFDAWAMTSIRENIAARPPVAPYLHGEAKWQPPETHLAWREEVEIIIDELRDNYPPADLLDDFPLSPRELLRDTTKRIVERLGKLAAARQTPEIKISAWLVDDYDNVEITDLAKFATDDKDKIKELENSLADKTLILPPNIGGLSSQGLFDGETGEPASDVSADSNRKRIRTDTPEIPDEDANDFRLIRVIDTQPDDDDGTENDKRYWLWLEAKNTVNTEKSSAAAAETLDAHTALTVAHARAIAAKIFPAPPVAGKIDFARCLILAAEFHDAGKNRRQWQAVIGNRDYDPTKPETIFAKSGGKMRSRNTAENYRHEFGALAEISAAGTNDLAELSAEERDLVLHLIAAHHGRARPHFPAAEIFDDKITAEDANKIAGEAPRRFARLQRRFGRWGLAWLESLLRAADYAASAGLAAAVSPTKTTERGCDGQ